MAAPVYNFLPVSGTFGFIVSEANGYRSREEITVRSGQGKLKAGTVMTLNAGTYIVWATGATNAAILCEECDATSAAVKRTIVARDAEVQRAMLYFGGTPTDPQKTEAYGVLAATNIVMR